ncbi:MAG: DUF4271 domain-containing protein [Cyclobacteriaceae bacterium]
MRSIKVLVFLLFAQSAIAQSDTIVVRDYTNIFITTDQNGVINPVTDYSKIDEAGFFLNGIPNGTLRICNDDELFAWVDGRLIMTIKGCTLIDPKILFEEASVDSIFFSFSASPQFENFRCELIVFDDLLIVKDEVSKPRKVRDEFREFCIITIIVLLVILGLFAATFQGRLNFFIARTFSLKASAYQFTNTSFFGRANLFMIVTVCLTAAFEIIYIDQKIVGSISTPLRLGSYTMWWLTISFWLLAFFFVKRVLTQTISGLFKMPKLRDWQLFDLVNFSGYFVLILFIIILWDFILKGQGDSWINSYFSYYFICVLLLFALWFIIKFVINSSYQKLLIISYLCATEIVPSILIMVWFLK